MTDQELKDLVASLAIESKKTDKRLNKLGKMVGAMSNSQGAVAEEFFINSIGSNQNVGGIQYDFMDSNASRQRNGIKDEFDILLVNGKDVAIIEVKYKLHQNDIDKLLNKKIVNFKKLYPEYKDYNHHLGLASFKVYDDLKQIALDNNIMVLQRKGDVIESFLPNK